MEDYFRPIHEPARLIYDVIQKESLLRKNKKVDDWIIDERESVWRAARDFAQKNGLRVLTMSEIEKAENQAVGHVDYGAKWAYGIVELLKMSLKKTV